ncbi:MAG: ATP-dependent RecD-like DNA helicase [Holosporales bacterium]|jgi:exodeoxyribonuclease V alpha subunit|nr:ATP-dependent RecD-like DNA helicase [Holosporales bacterium]
MHDIPGKLVKLRGQIERITYSEGGFVVAKVKVYNQNNLVTVVGNIPSPSAGSILDMQGEWSSHPKFGPQFKVTECTCSVPASIYGIQKYLQSGLIKGIGPFMAQKIVKEFGERTLDVIEHSAEELLKIEGIGAHRVKMIQQAWQEQKEIRLVILFLQSYDVSTTHATKIYQKYGNESIALVKENPYRLATDITGIGFLTADSIAKRLGIDEKSPMRAEAGILYVLKEISNDGHVFCSQCELIKKSGEILHIDDDILERAVQSLALSNKVVIERLDDVPCVFLLGYYVAETKVATKLTTLRDSQSRIKPIEAESALEWVQQKISITLADKQREAVKAAITEKLLVITGSPGTGKTTIIKAILEILSKNTPKIILTAPTGRAAKRMSETTGREAKTIHRLLEYVNGAFQRNENHPIDCDLLILDEASMVDILLMYHLLRAIPDYATIIIVGDINQLPSVGPGSVLKDIINSKNVTVVQLNEIFRQAQKSMIIVNAHKIINGDYPTIANKAGGDFYFIHEEDTDKAQSIIVQLIKDRIPRYFGYKPLADVQVLTPMHRGVIGTDSLNDALQNALNPRGAELLRGNKRFRLGDKVMQIRNNYDKDVFNGDIGFIERIDTENQMAIVRIDDRIVRYEHNELDELTLSYAVSIHKSQGSEYPVVVIPIFRLHYMMLQRNLVYTGITRGKKLVILVGSPNALSIAINNNKTMERNTWLSKRL